MPLTKSKIKAKLKKLTKTAQEAETTRWSINITRLLSIKSLCQDQDTACRFTMFLAHRTLEKMETRERSEYIETDTWERFKTLAKEGLATMETYLNDPTETNRDILYKLYSEIHAQQNTYRRVRSTQLRIIQSGELLMVEYALECALHRHSYTDSAYYMARQYVERYDSSQGTGINRESASMLWEIVHFWEQYYFGGDT